MTNENTTERSGKTRQILGMKGAAAGETSIWKIRLQRIWGLPYLVC